MPFVRRVLGVTCAAVRFCDFDQTRDVTEVNPDFVRNRRVVVRQDVEAMGFVGVKQRPAASDAALGGKLYDAPADVTV